MVASSIPYLEIPCMFEAARLSIVLGKSSVFGSPNLLGETEIDYVDLLSMAHPMSMGVAIFDL